MVLLGSCLSKRTQSNAGFGHQTVIELTELTNISQIFNSQSYEYLIRINYGRNPNVDTALVEQNGAIIDTFLVYGSYIVDPFMDVVDHNNNLIYRDELMPYNDHKGIDSKFYYNYFIGYPRMESTYYPNGHVSSIRENGENPLYKTWYRSGILQQKTDFEGQKFYSLDGILTKHIQGTSEKHYYSNGALRQILKDTMILDNKVRVKRDYYVNGIIKSEAFYLNKEPCFVWKTYSSKGELVKREAKKELVQNDEIEPIETNEILEVWDASTSLTYPGGQAALEKFVLENWNPDIKMGRKDVGIYTVRFKVSPKGVVAIEPNSLPPAESIQLELEQIVNKTSGIWPYSRMNRAVLKHYVVECMFRVSKKSL